ncbi:hypothetical protein [uncultured Friedmanniella sp.]|uniref:hypothetical protein n=1 Tax=uncultured Friedmanniella sp. TaxID=335381 RepID=UPI0035C993C2
MPIAIDPLPDAPVSTGRRADPLALAAGLALIAVAAVVGRLLVDRGDEILLPTPPLLAFWHPHAGAGTPLTLLCVVVGLRLQQVAARLSWRRLLLCGWLLAVSWLCSLALIDGFRRGWVAILLDPNEYLHDLPRITDPAEFLRTFTHVIAFGDGVTGDDVWTTHVAAHPPLATLVFWALDRVGLGGGFWAGALCILVASTAAVAMPVTLRGLGAPDAARRLVPFAALFPGSVWMAVSADGLFAGAAASGLALVCRGAARRRYGSALAGGLLLGAAVFLSYGLVLFGVVALVALGLTVRRLGWRAVRGPWLVAVAAALAVAAAHLALGFNWFTGLAELRVRYYQGVASQRPFSYFVYANPAAWLVSCSPLLAVGVGRALATLVLSRRGPWTQDRVVALICLAGVGAAALADVSALSKAETERIWLGFGVAAYAGVALLRGRTAAWALVAAAGWAIAVNHLLYTGW